MENYLAINKALWNAKVPVHVGSEFYGMNDFLYGKSSLKHVELDLLGDLKGKRVLHLQCHFGQDSISLARLGASVVGVDLSDAAIQKGQTLASELQADVTFICCDIYDLPNHLDEQFDLVFSSYGTIGWLPDMTKWAQVVSRFLKPSGKFVFVEFHPVVWMFDNDFTYVQYPYLKAEPIIEVTEGTYADREAPLQNDSVNWNHGLSEVMQALINESITIVDFKEYDYSAYNCFPNMEQLGEDRFQLKIFGNKIPMMYSLVGIKK